MTWPLVIMRVKRATYDDIKQRVIDAAQADRILSDGRISVDELAVEIDPNEDAFADQKLARALFDAMEGPINNQDARRQEEQWKLAVRLAEIATQTIKGDV